LDYDGANVPGAHVQATRPSQEAAVIVVEDEPVTAALFAGCLRAAGLAPVCLGSGAALRGSPEVARADLVLLDVELPDEDGYTLAAWLRQRSDAGIIFVSRRGSPVDRVRGLELGGDDFIVKPPDLDELIARVRAVLRRRGNPKAQAPGPRFAGWTFDPERFELRSPDDRLTPLTRGEAAMLAALVRARGAVVSRAELHAEVARDEPAASRSLDVLVHRVRKKLGEGGSVVPRALLTVHGIGYRLAIDGGDDATV